MPPDEQRRSAAQIAASKKAAAAKAGNAARTKAAALISTPGLTAYEAPPSTALAHRDHDDQHVHGARAPPERRAGDAVRAPLRTWVRFTDLASAGVVKNWTQLRRLIESEGFPPGRYLGVNSRAWLADEIEQWLDSRPSAVERERAAAEATP
jgi:hypothetical protein